MGLSVGLLGAGGSILTIPILIYLVGEPEKAAIAESLGIVGLIALASAIQYARRKLIVWRSALLFGVPGMLGAYLGAALAEFVPAAFQLTLLAVLMVLAAIMMWRPPRWGASDRRAHWKIASDGLLVGAFTGLVGVGGGFLIVPTLALVGGLTMHEAVGTSLVIIVFNSLISFWKHVDVLDSLGVALNPEVIGLFAAIGVLGSLAGSAASGSLPQHRLRQIFAIAVLLTGLYLTSQNLPALLAD